MSNLRNAKSIDQFNTFTEQLAEYVELSHRTQTTPHSTLEEEKAPAFQSAEAAEYAAYNALVAVIDAYCAAKTAEAFEPANTHEVIKTTSPL